MTTTPMTTKIEPLEPGLVQAAHDLTSTTMEERGNLLPASGLAFEFHPPTMGRRKKLGAVNANPALEKLPSRRTAYWLAKALRSLGDLALESIGEDKAALEVARLPCGDILYLMFAWHREAHPNGFPLTGASCPQCGISWETVTLNLGALEVRVCPTATSADPLIARVGLRHGVTLKGATVQTLLVTAPTWLGSWWGLQKAQWANTDLVKAWTYKASVIATDAGTPFLMEHVDELMPEDTELLDEAIGQVTPTPVLMIGVDCPTCGAESQVGLDWRSADFLGGSARG